VAEEIREYHIPDFANWKDHDAFEAAFARLIKDLEAPASTGEGTEGRGRESPPKAPASTSGGSKGRVRKGRPKRP
jgi:hypothetical protein